MTDFNITFPFQKIDKKKRIVTGIATADNVDSEDDKIDFEASIEAFSDWIGNIREMHQPIAVGKMIDWRPVPVMHKGRVYNGVEVSVYISKGAQDTWEKILDKTLRGFSIGGRALERDRIYDEELGKSVNYITKYILGELSVVDNPANPAGMFTMVKMSKDGSLVYEDEYLDDEISKSEDTIYYCTADSFATIGGNKNCVHCNKEMEPIGRASDLDAEVIEKMLKEGGIEKVMNLQEKTNDDTITNTMNQTTIDKEGVLSRLDKFLFGGDTEEETVDSSAPTVVVNITSDILKNASEDTVQAEDVEPEDKKEDEVVEDSAIEKSVEDEGGNEVDTDELIAKFSSILDEKLSTVKDEIKAEVDEKIESIQKSVDDVSDKVEKQDEEIEKVANSGAEKKSEVIEDELEEDDKIEKSAKTVESFWGGIFLPDGVAEILGYDS